MKLLLFLQLFSLSFCTFSFSQKVNVGFQTGIGSYSMSDLDKLNKFTMNALPFDAKLVSDFPPYIYFQPSVMVKFNDASIGLIYNYYSTGSRVSAKDYSGEYRFDLTAFAHSPGICGIYKIWNIRDLEVNIQSTLGFSRTVLDLNEYLSIGDTIINNETIRFNSYNFYFEPGIHLVYKLKFLRVGLYGGYSVNFNSVPFYYMEKSNKLTIANDPIKPDWAGYRFGFSIAYPLEIKLFEFY